MLLDINQDQLNFFQTKTCFVSYCDKMVAKIYQMTYKMDYPNVSESISKIFNNEKFTLIMPLCKHHGNAIVNTFCSKCRMDDLEDISNMKEFEKKLNLIQE